MAPDLFFGDSILRQKYGAKAPSAALVNPMYTRQGGNPRSVQQSKFIGDKNREGQEHLMNDLGSRLQAHQSTVHDGSGVGRTGRVLSYKNSERGRLAVAAKKLNGIYHSNGNKNEYELLQTGQPCDPVTFFRRTHDPEKKINAKCKEMSEKMKAMKEAADRGETNDTPEEIFNNRRRDHPTNYGLYQKKEEEMAELKVRMASLEQENKRLKKETGPKATKKWLNEYLVKVGMPAMELSSENDAEDADLHGSQIHEHRDSFEGSDREVEEEDVEAFADDQEEGEEENPDRKLEEDDEEE
ncbi:hypothetical protein MKW92_031556 [Papaver armeniacum]|nr:hypothetical protein MKW92_031556 [Papaver armeniacum]